jgi:two-component system, NarL family, sensor histidine kinase DesK
MHGLPKEIKLTFILAFFVLLVLALFIILLVRLFNKKQVTMLLKQRLLEKEIENEQLLANLAKEKALQAERQRIAYDMHDDLGSTLSAIKMRTQLLKLQYKDDANTATELDGIVQQTTSLATSMKEMIWFINPGNDSLEHFITQATLFVKQFCNQVQIKLNLTVAPKTMPEIIIDGTTRRNLYLTIKEVFNNAAKYANTSTIDASFTLNNNLLEIIIVDNGIGMPNNYKANNGLVTMQKRMDVIGAKIEKQNVNGLTITITKQL